ncbi:MAG: alanine/ornithine racemase family PLP-dependent enzyme [candidate division Zixibacteria bacterium]|nr:alanine/ornithine racemase family PLP-dependent enzyme [candidate division Zixibacteria bacterium]
MNRVLIDVNALSHNINVIDRWMREHNSSWTLVTKVLCGHHGTLKALHELGIKSIGESRLANIRAMKEVSPEIETWYLRLPYFSAIPDIVELGDVSLNSETEIIEEINMEAKRQDKLHGVIVMIELGDLREGILPGTLVEFYNRIFKLPNVKVLGIGSNLGCLAGAIPNEDQLMQLVLYKELLELKFGHTLPLISAGSSSLLPLLLEGKVPGTINHFRIGEAVFLGTDLINGGTLRGLRNDAITLEAEVAEIKEKSLVTMGENGVSTPFESIDDNDFTPGQRGYRAIVTIGQLDTEVAGLTPMNEDYNIAGASSDLTVVNIGDEQGDLKVGDVIKFRPNYGATLRLMNNRYIDHIIIPPNKDSLKQKEEAGEDSFSRIADEEIQ